MMVKTLGSNRVLVKDNLVWDFVPALVLISGQEILEIKKNPSREDIAQCEHWFGDDLITPGFVDSHTHLSLQFLRGGISNSLSGNLVEDLFFKLEEKLTPADVRAFSMMGAYEVLLSGTTFVWDHYYYGADVAQAMKEVGLTGTVASTLQDLSGPGQNLWEMGLDYAKQLGSDLNFKKSGIFPALGPHATDTVSEDLWRKVSELSDQLNLPIHSHVAQSPEEYTRVFSKYGCSPTEHLDRLGVLSSKQPKHLVHMIYASQSDLELCQSSKARLVACPHSQMIFNVPASYLDWWRQGNLWTIGTDCSASNDSWSMADEVKTISGWPMLSASFSAEMAEFKSNPSRQVIEKITHLRSKTLNENLVGQDELLNILFLGASDGKSSHPKINGISPGSLANLLLWNANDPSFWPMANNLRSLIYSSVIPALKGIMTCGIWRGKIGQPRYTLINSEHYLNASAEAFRRLSELLKRAGLKL